MKSRVTMKYIWLLIGLLALGLGFLGAILPLVPATVFFLVAAFCFARSSPRLHAWLTQHKYFGPPIQDWQERGAISRQAKGLAMISIIATPIVTWWLGAPRYVVYAQIIVLTAVSIFILTRPD